MLAERTKLMIAGCLLSILLSILGCVGINMLMAKVDKASSQLPARRLRVTIDISQREELFDQLRKFANKHAFEFIISDYNTGGENFLVEILGDEIKILSTGNPKDADKVSIGFYGKYPGYPVNEETIDDLLNDLKSFISEIPNVKITEEK